MGMTLVVDGMVEWGDETGWQMRKLERERERDVFGVCSIYWYATVLASSRLVSI
jgi:hypothetical protein